MLTHVPSYIVTALCNVADPRVKYQHSVANKVQCRKKNSSFQVFICDLSEQVFSHECWVIQHHQYVYMVLPVSLVPL